MILYASMMITPGVEVDWHKWSVLLKAQDLIMLLPRMGTVSVGIGDISGSPRSIFMTKMNTAGPETVEQPVAQRRSSRPVKVPQRLIEQC